MIDVMIRGRLVAAPERRETRGGKPYVRVTMSVTDKDGSQHTALVHAFDEGACDSLAALAKGDRVALAGELSIGTWQPEGGDARVSLRLVAHAVMTPCDVKRRRDAARSRRIERTGNGPAAARTTWGSPD